MNKTNENILYFQASSFNQVALFNFLCHNFSKYGSLTQSVSLTPEEMTSYMQYEIRQCVGTPVSFVALNKQNEVIGCRLSDIINLDEKRSSGPENHSPLQGMALSKNCQAVDDFEVALERGYPELLQQYHKALKFHILCVRKDYWRQGIAQHLTCLAEKEGKRQGCDVAVATATGVNSQSLFEKIGYKDVKVIKHSQWLDKDGEQIFFCYDGTTCGKLMYKQLKLTADCLRKNQAGL